MTEKFSDYLYGNHFTVVTDSNPLTYILTSAKLDATSYRWLAALSTFSFKLLQESKMAMQMDCPAGLMGSWLMILNLKKRESA